jgi:hypothetical protein
MEISMKTDRNRIILFFCIAILIVTFSAGAIQIPLRQSGSWHFGVLLSPCGCLPHVFAW